MLMPAAWFITVGMQQGVLTACHISAAVYAQHNWVSDEDAQKTNERFRGNQQKRLELQAMARKNANYLSAP